MAIINGGLSVNPGDIDYHHHNSQKDNSANTLSSPPFNSPLDRSNPNPMDSPSFSCSNSKPLSNQDFSELKKFIGSFLDYSDCDQIFLQQAEQNNSPVRPFSPFHCHFILFSFLYLLFSSSIF